MPRHGHEHIDGDITTANDNDITQSRNPAYVDVAKKMVELREAYHGRMDAVATWVSTLRLTSPNEYVPAPESVVGLDVPDDQSTS